MAQTTRPLHEILTQLVITEKYLVPWMLKSPLTSVLNHFGQNQKPKQICAELLLAIMGAWVPTLVEFLKIKDLHTHIFTILQHVVAFHP